MTANQLRTLLSPDTSRCNKMHLAAAWNVPWRWAGDGPEPNGLMRSRMQFWNGSEWLTAKSWDEDIRSKLIDMKAA